MLIPIQICPRELRPVDLRDYQQTLEILDGAESLFHLAARVGSVEFLHGSDMAELLALQTNLVIDANVLRACLEKGIRTYGIEGEQEGHWVLIDYGDVVIHIFYQPYREFYDLEGLWVDAPRINLEDDFPEDIAP